MHYAWNMTETFATPSPESEHWSSPSPQTSLTSPHSDWSEPHTSPTEIHQTNKGATEAIYI